jgi:hypothetical protein
LPSPGPAQTMIVPVLVAIRPFLAVIMKPGLALGQVV